MKNKDSKSLNSIGIKFWGRKTTDCRQQIADNRLQTTDDRQKMTDIEIKESVQQSSNISNPERSEDS